MGFAAKKEILEANLSEAEASLDTAHEAFQSAWLDFPNQLLRPAGTQALKNAREGLLGAIESYDRALHRYHDDDQ